MNRFTFDFTGLHGMPARCGLEVIPISDGRTVVICTELANNPGVSVTNFAEELAMLVCEGWNIHPEQLVWIEHYPADPCPVCDGSGRREKGPSCRACDGRGTGREVAAYDLVTFTVSEVRNRWVLSEPQWRPMREEDWRGLGIPVRR